ncbi:MAG TPA: hypothetical protein VF941_16325 [Clostridia bacterium]
MISLKKITGLGLAAFLGCQVASPLPFPHITSHGVYADNITNKLTTQTNVVTSQVDMQKVTPTPTSTITPPKVVELADEEPSQQSIKQYIYEKFGSGWQGQVAQCIAFHESGYNPNATHWNYNGSVDRGVFQINSVHGYSASTLYNWQDNINIAYQMSGAGNVWGAWTTEKYCL